MRMMIGSAAVLVLSAGLTGAADTTVALTGDNAKVTFIGSKPDGKHEGGFKKLTGKATVTDGDLTKAKFEVEIDMNSTYSDSEKLTAHLKSPDFFGVKSNPKSKFVSTKVEKAQGGGYTVTGDLTLNGQTKSLSFPATMSLADGTLKLKSDFTINRQDYGMAYGKGKVDDEVKIKLDVEAK